jgi:hypothetical protein
MLFSILINSDTFLAKPLLLIHLLVLATRLRVLHVVCRYYFFCTVQTCPHTALLKQTILLAIPVQHPL